MDFYKKLELKSKKKLKTIIYPESYDNRVISAVKTILRKKIAKVVLIKKSENTEINIGSDINLTVIDSDFSSQFLNQYHNIKIKKYPGYSKEASAKEISDPLTFSCMLLKNNFADGIIAGSVYSTSDVLRKSISILGPEKKFKSVSSFFLFTFPSNSIFRNRILAYADCGVIPFPDAEQLAEIAIQTSINYKKLTGLKPRTAFLSFSTKGSARDKSIEKITEAVLITKKRYPSLLCEGELQFDAAFIPEIAKRKNPGGILRGDANVFIFPDLNSGNIAYKITERIGLATATGPVLQGLSRKVMDLSRGCKPEDIVNMTNLISNLI